MASSVDLDLSELIERYGVEQVGAAVLARLFSGHPQILAALAGLGPGDGAVDAQVLSALADCSRGDGA